MLSILYFPLYLLPIMIKMCPYEHYLIVRQTVKSRRCLNRHNSVTSCQRVRDRSLLFFLCPVALVFIYQMARIHLSSRTSASGCLLAPLRPSRTLRSFVSIPNSKRPSGGRFFSQTSVPHDPPSSTYKLHLVPSGVDDAQYLAVLPVIQSTSTALDDVSWSSLSDCQPSQQFAIKSAGEHKGLGMFALDAVSAGVPIVYERPALFAALFGTGLAEVTNLPEALASLSRENLSSAVVESMLQLSQATGALARVGEDNLPAHALERVFATNSIRTDVERRGESGSDSFVSLLLQSSRCNHSCSPNTLLNFDPQTFTYALTPTSDITPNTELTLGYVDVTLPGEQRRAELLQKWGFTCECPTCTLPPSIAAESDEQREKLHWWFHEAENRQAASISLRPASHEAPPLSKSIRNVILPSVEEYVSLSDAEDFLHTDYLYFALERGAFSYALLGERDEFQRWAMRAQQQLRVLGPTPAARRANFSIAKWGDAIADPEGTIERWAECKL
ncbi:hypothetical protein DL93DRAFT_435413 [Clavulina sp. PMI_390]|nr:hypothetical protein DL93DRAFT_435413 [Clavulina sp. PMI_390]